MATKDIKTRIILTHDDYASLKAKHLKDGEVVLAKVAETTDGNVTQPVFMMKVGTADSSKTVAELPWLMAPAADVHGWAKKANLDPADVPTLDISKINGLQAALDALTAEDLRLAGLIGGLRTDVDAVRSDFDAHNHDSQYKKIQTAVEEKGAADKTLKISQDAQGVITTEEVAIQIAQSQVTGLADALDGKSDEGHKHVKADITDFAHTHTKSEITDFEHNHKASELTDFDADVKAVVNTMGLGTNDTIKALSDRMDTAESDIDALEGAVATKVESTTYEAKVAELAKADTDEAAAREALAGRVGDLETASATHATKTYVDEELAKKVDTTTYEAKVEALEAKDSELTTAVEAAQADADEANRKIDVFMGTIESSTDVVDTLQEVLALIEDGSDVAEGLLNDITGLKAKFDENGKALEAVNADTVDGKHAADFEVAGAAAEALDAAKDYTDDEISEYDVAATAKFESKTDAANKLAEAKAYAKELVGEEAHYVETDCSGSYWEESTGVYAYVEGKVTPLENTTQRLGEVVGGLDYRLGHEADYSCYPESTGVFAKIENLDRDLRITIGHASEDAACGYVDATGIYAVIEAADKELEDEISRISNVVGHAYINNYGSCDDEPATGLFKYTDDKVAEAVSNLQSQINGISFSVESGDTAVVEVNYDCNSTIFTVDLTDDYKDRIWVAASRAANAIQDISVGTGLKVQYSEDDGCGHTDYTSPTISIDEEVVFILNGGNASNLD